MATISYAMSDEAVMLELGDRVKQRRLSTNIKQAEMAESIGISLPTYRKIEKGRGTMAEFISVLRILNDLESLNHLLMVPLVSPMALLKQTPKRKRASQPSGPQGGKSRKNAVIGGLMLPPSAAVVTKSLKRVTKVQKDNGPDGE